MKPLAKWKSHKVVEAGKIKSIIPPGTIDRQCWVLQIENEEGSHNELKVSNDTFSRGIPVPQDYLIIYPDGYVSWSPRAAFEDGYRKIETA